MKNLEKSEINSIDIRLEEEKENIMQLQERWDIALEKLYKYFDIATVIDEDENNKLREIENKTLDSIEKNSKPTILGFAGPGGAGKGTVRAQIKNALEVGDIINSTTRDKRDYEIDGTHYNFITTEEISSRIVLNPESLKNLQSLLDLDEIPENVTKEHLDALQQLVDEQFKKGEIEDGIDLYPDAQNPKNELLNLTLRPLRGWYTLAINDLENTTSKNSLSSFEESAPNMLRVGEGMKNQDTNFYLVYVLPEQPIAKTMAQRALKRDGVEQDTEKLLSTIGGRQILEFEKMANMLISGKYSTKIVLLVNDEGYEKDGEFITRTGSALAEKLK